MSKRTIDSPAPSHLGPHGRAFWSEMVSTFEMEAHDLARLDIACDCLDRIAQARAVLATDGLNRIALSAWRDSIKLFLSSVRQMGVDTADLPKSTLPAIHAPRRA